MTQSSETALNTHAHTHTQTLDLPDNGFKKTIINMFNKLKDNTDK